MIHLNNTTHHGDLHSNNDISLTVPEELELQGIDDWYTKEGVYGANAYYCKSKKREFQQK